MKSPALAVRLVPAALVLGLICACDVPPAGTGASKTGPRGASAGDSGGGAAAADRKASPKDPSISSIEAGKARQVYYQFTDSSGSVRFVTTLADVPPEWRPRVGFVEMDAPPPGTPSAAQRIRTARAERARAQTPDSLPAAQDEAGAYADVLIYSADWCGACRAAKRYMDDRGIAYEERNVDNPDNRDEMIAKAGPGGIPVFDVNGSILRGFSPQMLEQLIQTSS